ncbi:hypothetical protein QE152_g21710 [Popillia japonica]|uniref:Uncharacterized protein n=1 Tax=Popillia japonica TaxID=7064 RepID=A0AAW1KMN1_POPJA
MRERTKRNASGYSSGSDISDFDLSSPASIDSIVASVNRQQKRTKVSSAEKASAEKASASGNSETRVSEMAEKIAENGSAVVGTSDTALITHFKCAVKNKFDTIKQTGQRDYYRTHQQKFKPSIVYG